MKSYFLCTADTYFDCFRLFSMFLKEEEPEILRTDQTTFAPLTMVLNQICHLPQSTALLVYCVSTQTTGRSSRC